MNFPPVIHTGKGDSANEITYFSLSQFQPKLMCSFWSTNHYQNNNFLTQILESFSLKSSILSTKPLTGQYYGLEVIRFRTPYLYNQTGFNNEAYKGFLVYNRIEWFEQERISEMRLQDCDLTDTDKSNFFFKNCFKGPTYGV